MKVICGIALFYFIMIFPLFFKINFYFNKDLKKAFFSINMFNFIKIISGIIEIKEQNLAIHVSIKKAIIIPFGDIIKKRPDLSLFKGINIYKVNSLIRLGKTEDIFIPTAFSLFYEGLVNATSYFAVQYKPFLKLDNDITVIEEKETLNFYLNMILIGNLGLITIIFIKLILGKIINGTKRKN